MRAQVVAKLLEQQANQRWLCGREGDWPSPRLVLVCGCSGTPVIAPSLCNCPVLKTCTHSPNTQSWLRRSYVDGVASSVKAHPWYWWDWRTCSSFHKGSSSCCVSLSAHSAAWVCDHVRGAICTSTLCAWASPVLHKWGTVLFCPVRESGCTLDPGLEEGAVLLGHLLDDLTEYVPAQPCQQVLMVWSLGKSDGALTDRFAEECLLEFPPRVLEADLILNHVVRGRPSPSV